MKLYLRQFTRYITLYLIPELLYILGVVILIYKELIDGTTFLHRNGKSLLGQSQPARPRALNLLCRLSPPGAFRVSPLLVLQSFLVLRFPKKEKEKKKSSLSSSLPSPPSSSSRRLVMSSSQTMTAPALGHRPPPPNSGPDMPFYDDYTHPDNRDVSSPLSDSAIRAVNNSTTSDRPGSPPSAPLNSNGLPSLSSPFSSPSGGIGGGLGDGGMAGIKMEPDDEVNGSNDHQTDLRRQSAASALLAQLLGNQTTEQTPSADVNHLFHYQGDQQQQQQQQQSASAPPAQSDPFTSNAPEESRNNAQPIDGDTQMQDYPPPLPPIEDVGRDHHSAPAAQASGQDQVSIPADLGQQDEHQANGEPQGPFTTNPDDTDANAFLQPPPKTSDPSAIESLTDPLLMAKSNLDQTDYFNGPFNITADPKTPFGDLEQNEMLTAAYLSGSADLAALGLPDAPLHQDRTGSVAGSEPRIQAFAKLEFDDGHFYCNTYSFILGRDVRAARAAHQREFQVRQAMRNSRPKSSSGGNASHTPIRVKHEGSGILGSVVSDRGGIMGFDPEVPSRRPMSRRSSNSSFGESGPPLLATPAQLQSTDYNALAMQSLNEGNGDAKPVDTLALLPSPDSCPTIPIHPPATMDGSVAGHRGISRKHVKIAYNFDKSLFEMEVMGRNGAFIGADWLSPGQIRPLHSGDYIQIGGVRIRFLLPDVPIGETGADRMEEPYPEEDENVRASVELENNADEAEKRGSDASEKKDASKAARLVLKTKDADSSQPIQSSIEGDASQQPVRRRGPGRPPKDGIMSKRERAELAREQKLAAKREANGGVTPPPPNRSKAGKAPAAPRDSISAASGQGVAAAGVPAVATPGAPVAGGAESPGSKPEKRKYTKRKKPDGTLMDTPLPSMEGGSQFPMEQRPEEFIKAPPLKKRKPSRSPSPNYPPESAYTPEDLAKPPYNYAVLIFDALTDAGTPMTLKQIYRALKLKYPYFRFKCETEGWTSSVRHNLNGNSHLFMHAERDGKGWSWQLRPGASVEKEKKRRPSPPPPSSHTPIPAAQPYMPPPGYTAAKPSNGQPNMVNQHFQFPPSMAPNPYAPPPAPAPGPAPVHAPAPAPAPPPAQPPAQQPPAPQQATGPSPSPAPAPTQGPSAPGQAPGPAPASVPTSTPAPVPNSVPASAPPPPAPAPAPAPAPTSTPQPQHSSPYLPPAPPQPPQTPAPAPNPAPTPFAPFSIPSPIRNSLPRAFAQTVPTTYTSPYAFDPPPQLAQFQQSQQQSQPLQAPPPQQQQQQPQQPPQQPQYQQAPQPHPQSAYPPPQNPAPMPMMNHQPPGYAPNPGPPPMQQQPPPFNAGPAEPNTGPMDEDTSFNERAGKAIDDFEAVLMEDYEDKNYIREVLRSARARVLGEATESSFPGGEPKDEAVILDALRNLVGSLEG